MIRSDGQPKPEETASLLAEILEPCAVGKDNINGTKEHITVPNIHLQNIHLQNNGYRCGSRDHESHCNGPESSGAHTPLFGMQSKC